MANIKLIGMIITIALFFPLIRIIGIYIGVTYLTITIGIFATIALFITTIILYKENLSIGPWIIISSATLFLTVSEVFRVFIQDLRFHQLFFTSSMILLGIVAIIKYWDTLELME